MERSQQYIGTPNGVVLCVNRFDNEILEGQLYHLYRREPIEFIGMGHMLEYMECFFDALGFPCPDTNVRTFSGQRRTRQQPQRKLKVMKDQELLQHHGDLGSFVIRVQHRQNSSWQGRITWMEKNKTVAFRSAFELMRLIEDALNTVTDYQGATWHTEQTHQKKNNENP